MIVRKLRLQRGWSQDQLARVSGLHLRTIQRIERGHNAGLESLKSLAAAFEVEITDLTTETVMNADSQLSKEEKKVMRQVRDLKEFYSHLIVYVVVVSLLFLVNFILSPGYLWVKWAALGWGIGLVVHGLSVYEPFNFFGPEWERKQIEKRLGRKL